MSDVAGWIAPIATMLAAMMTAANLGARVTGWGFVLFVAGSICWSIVGLSLGQSNLLATNAFLTLVNVVGVWRWLGRQRSYEDGGKSAENASRQSSVPTLFTATGIAGLPVHDGSDEKIATAVEALLQCQTGQLSYVVVARGGVGGVAETLHAVEREAIRFHSDKLELLMDSDAFDALPQLDEGAWPSEAPQTRTVMAR